MKRRLIITVAAVVLVAAGATVALIRGDPSAALPSRDELATSGFAVWPEDTVEEAVKACEDPEPWRLDPRDAAFQFARDVLRYPDPALNTDPIVDEEGPANQIRYLVGGPGTDLGSVIDVRRYGRCWYVVRLEPRERGFLPSIGYTHHDGETDLILSTRGADTQVSYGDWETNVTSGQDQVVLPLPALPPDATGHIMSLGQYRDVRNGSAAPLGFIPEPATRPPTRMTMDEVMEAAGVCRRNDAYRHPGPALYELFGFTFDAGVGGMRGHRIDFRPGYGAERVEGDRWLLDVGATELEARIPKIKRGCWRVLSFTDGGPRILRSLRLNPDTITFDLGWRGATSATLTVSTSRGGNSWTFEKVTDPVTVRNHQPWLLDEPLQVTVVLRDGRRIVAAERDWYRPTE